MEKGLNREEMMQREILKKYPSVRLFLRHVGFSQNKEFSAVLNRTEDYLYVCELLGLNPYTLEPMNAYVTTDVSITENKLLHSYLTLNQMGRARVMEVLEDLNAMKKYRRTGA